MPYPTWVLKPAFLLPAAIKALRSALARPIVSPCMEALLTRHTNSSHQRLTKSMLAKQRQTTGAADDQKVGWAVAGQRALYDGGVWLQ